MCIVGCRQSIIISAGNNTIHTKAIQSKDKRRRSTARQIQSKRAKFVCPSSALPLSLLLAARAGSEGRSTARQIQSKMSAGSERRLTARQIQPKSKIRLSVVNRTMSAGLERQPTARQIQSIEQNSSVVNLSAVRWLGTAIDGQTDSVKKNKIRLFVVNLSAFRWLGTATDGQTARQLFLHVPKSEEDVSR